MAGATRTTGADRGNIAKRFAVTLVCMMVFEVVSLVVQIAALFQFGYLLIAKKRSEPLRLLCNRLSRFGYQIMRYTTLNDNTTPFPFSDFPSESDCEPPSKQVLFK